MGLPSAMGDGRRGRLAVLVALGLVQATALGVAAFATRDAFAAIHAGAAPGAPVLTRLVAAGVLAAACEGAARVVAEALGQAYAAATRGALYAHIAGMSRRDLDARRLGALSLRFVGDLSALRGWYGRGLPGSIAAALVLPGVAMVLFLLDPRLGLAATAPLGASLLAMGLVAWGLDRRHSRLRSDRAGVAIAAMERIASAPELDLMGRTEAELRALEASGDRLRRSAVARARRATILRLLPQVGAAAGGVAVLAVAGGQGVAPATAAAALSMLAILTLPLHALAEAWDRFCAWRIARDKLQAVFAKPSRARAMRRRRTPVAVTVQGPGIDAVIPAGALVRIDGPRAAGKSRLAAAIAGLDRPPDLQVRYDGPEATLPRIAFLGDEPIVLRGSLRRVLTLGRRQRPADARVEAVARRYGLGPLVERLGGIGGRVETARALASGEGLRIALARAALSGPDLVVIDSGPFRADPDAGSLLKSLRADTGATVVVAGDAPGLPRPDATVTCGAEAVD